ncbi:MAG: hypothetical protein ACKO2V_19520, partial [Snowella sp.]
VPYYAVFSRYRNELQVFQLVGNHYEAVSLIEGKLSIPEAQLKLGLWRGEYRGCDRLWLRWFTQKGELIALDGEKLTVAKQEANLAKQEANLAKQEATIAKEEVTIAKEEVTIAKEEATIAKEEANLAKQEVTIAKEEANLAKQEVIAAEQRAEQLAAMLRQLGINPDEI